MSINGGIKSLDEAKTHLAHMDGVMVGREAYQNPGILTTVDRGSSALKAQTLTRLPWCGPCIRTLNVS